MINYCYDISGLRTNAAMYNRNGTLVHQNAFAYDAQGKVLEATAVYGTEMLQTLKYDYDAAGNLTNIVGAIPQTSEVAYQYDTLNRLTNVVTGGASVVGYGYDPVGNLEDVRYDNDLQHQYQYNTLNRLTNLTVRKASDLLLGYAYTLNALGYRDSVVEESGRTVNYTYDALGRLLSETIANDPQLIMGLARYEYDKVGNRLQRNSNIRDVLAQVLSYDDNDRLTIDTSDQNGNTIASSAGTDVYDYRNRLIRRIQSSGEKVDYVYDADGNRIAKTIRAADNSLIYRIKFVVDSQNLTGYAQTLEEWSADGTNTLTLSRTFTYGLDLVRQQLWNAGAWQTRCYLYDGHGTVRGLTDLFGNLTDTYTYDAFGIELSRTGTTANNYRYCGEYYDEDLGLYYLRARHMNPETGRFWTMDTYEGVNAEPMSLHKYLYAHANPVMMSDPSGLMTLTMTDVMTVQAIMVTVMYIAAPSYVKSSWNAAALALVVSMQRVCAEIIMSSEMMFANTKGYKKRINSLIAVASLHAAKLASNPGNGPGGPQGHWREEVRAALEKAKHYAEKYLKGNTRDEVLKEIEKIAAKAGVELM